MRPNRRYLVLATVLLALVALALAADEAPTSPSEPGVEPPEPAGVLVPIETPYGTVTLFVPPGRVVSPEFRQRINDRLAQLPRFEGVAPTAPPTPCTAQGGTARTANGADPCAFGAEIATMTPCPANDPAECAAYRAWSERFGAPEALPAPVELGVQANDDQP